MTDYGDCRHCPKLELSNEDALDVTVEMNAIYAMFEAGEIPSGDETLKRAAEICKGVVTAEVVEDGDRFEITVCRQPIASQGLGAAYITRQTVQSED